MAKLDAYLTRKAQVVAERQAGWTASPESALLTLKASSKVAGITGARPIQMGEHKVLSDSATGLAGHALGPTAPELLLGALASCLVHTYLIQAALMNIALDDVQVEVTGRLDMAGAVAIEGAALPLISPISYQAHIEADATPAQIQAMHDAVETGCPVLLTLRQPVQVSRIP